MTEQIFAIDGRNLKRLEKFWQRSPKKFKIAVGMLLNNFAFGTREEILKYLPQKMIIRNEGFVRHRIKVKKTATSIPIHSQESEVGSVLLGGSKFSGWSEQEARTTTKRKHLATIKGRRGSKKKRIPRKYRMRGVFAKSSMFAGRTGIMRTFIMLQTFRQNEYKEPFIIHEHPGFRKGLYKFESGTLHMLIDLEPKNLQPRGLAWLSESRDRYFGHVNMSVEWGKVLKRILKF